MITIHPEHSFIDRQKSESPPELIEPVGPERRISLLYGDEALLGLHHRDLDVEEAGIVAGRDTLLGDVLTEGPGAGVGGLVLAVLTGAGDGEVVVLHRDLDVGAAEAGHLHGDGVSTIVLVDGGTGLGGAVAAIASSDKVLEEDVEGGVVVIAIHEAEHAAFSLVDGGDHPLVCMI